MTAFSSDIRAIFPASDFLHIAQFASTETTRYYLNGVHVAPTPDGVHLVATDGLRMGVLRLPATEGYCAPNPVGATPAHIILSISNKAFLAALKATKKDAHWIVIRTETVEVRWMPSQATPAPGEVIDSGLVTQTFPASALLVDGTFPDWRRVVPSLDGAMLGSRASHVVSPHDDAPKARPVTYSGVDPAMFKGMTRAGEPCATFDWNGDGPLLVATQDPRFLGVVMPMRGGLSPDEMAARRAAVLG